MDRIRVYSYEIPRQFHFVWRGWGFRPHERYLLHCSGSEAGQSPCIGPHVPPDPATYGTLHLSLDEELEDVNLLQQLASAVGLVIG